LSFASFKAEARKEEFFIGFKSEGSKNAFYFKLKKRKEGKNVMLV